MMNNYDIVLIDSGVEKFHTVFQKYEIEGISLDYDSTEILTVSDDYTDHIGHGTAITYILKKSLPDSSIFVLKIFEKGEDVQVEKIIDALEYVYNNIDCKIVHLSCGVTYCYNIKQLYETCLKLRKKGIIIVAAFDNDGCLSYPAVFDEVIGVDFCLSCRHVSDYQYVEGSPINVRAIGGEQRVAWLHGTYRFVSGSSFAAPHITTFVLKEIRKGNTELNGIKEALKEHAVKVYEKELNLEGEDFTINKAIIFPFNKEEHSILAFNDLLHFKIQDIFDLRMSGKVNKKTSEILYYIVNKNMDYTIKDYEQIDWDTDFDTIIIGHLREISNLLKKDVLRELLVQCSIHKKNVYCFDSLDNYHKECDQLRLNGCKIFYPHIKKDYIPKNRFGKLNCIGRPVLMVMGTSSKQGKFTLQLLLRRKLLELGYKVGQLGTEPSALLYGIDEVYPVGYDSTVEVQSYQSIHMINYLLSKIEKKEPDLILVGSQSHTIHLNNGNLSFYPMFNYELLIATNPDAVILCVNYKDDITYIKKTIEFIEVFQDAKVISIVVYPVEKQREWFIFSNSSYIPSDEDIQTYIEELTQQVHLPVSILKEGKEIDNVVDCITEFFT